MRAMKSRPVRAHLTQRLPTRILRLARQLGALADERGVALYLVGGAVRDLLLNRKNWDLDLTVEGDGIAFARLVAERYRAGLVLFERFATARLVFPNGIKIDIASTRRESYAQPAALPDVEPASLKEDLYRRDFTINAMAIQLNAAQFGRLHDPHGGQHDLKAKTLRVLHEGSFREDPTRIFRAIRFSQRCGFRLEPATRRQLTEAAKSDLVARLSGPRLCNEILLLSGESHPERSFALLARLKLLRFLHPTLRYAGPAEQIVQSLPKALGWWATQCAGCPIDRPLVHVMALLGGAEQAVVETVAARLMLSSEHAGIVRASGKRLKTIARRLGRTVRLRPSEIYDVLIGLPDEALVVCLAMGAMQTAQLGRMTRRLLDFVRRLRMTKSILRGDDLLRMGLEPGPQVSDLLAQLLKARLDGVVRTKRDEQAFVRALLAHPGTNRLGARS